MTDTDFAVNDSEDGFTADEQAAWDAMRSGETAPEPQAAPEPAPGSEPAAPAAAAAEPAAPGEVVDPDAEDADDPEKNRGRFVRHGAFHKEREARKAAQRELSEMREKFTRGDERLRLLTEAARAPQPAAATPTPAEPPKVIDPKEDIFGAYDQLKSELEALRNGVTEETTRQRREREVKTVVDDYKADLNRFGAQEPAFADAFRFVAATRAAELKALGHPEAHIPQLLGKEELEIAVAARQQGVSPAELLFQVAKARGFAPKAAEPAPAPAPAAPVETAAEKHARVEAGQKGPGMSLSAAGGSPAGEVTAEMLANMSDEEFAAFSKNNGRKLRTLMGAG